MNIRFDRMVRFETSRHHQHPRGRGLLLAAALLASILDCSPALAAPVVNVEGTFTVCSLPLPLPGTLVSPIACVNPGPLAPIVEVDFRFSNAFAFPFEGNVLINRIDFTLTAPAIITAGAGGSATIGNLVVSLLNSAGYDAGYTVRNVYTSFTSAPLLPGAYTVYISAGSGPALAGEAWITGSFQVLPVAPFVFTPLAVLEATSTVGLQINNAGNVAVATDTGSYVYKSGTFSPLPAPPPGVSLATASGINDAGTVVGSFLDSTGTVETGFILSNGAYRTVAYPGWANTEARAVSNSGLVTGFAYVADLDPRCFGLRHADLCPVGSMIGFIFDPGTGTFTDILPAGSATRFVLVHGINSAGQVVGSYVADGDAFTGQTAFLRDADGTIHSFQINGNITAARGINDNGLISGWMFDGTKSQAFVGTSTGYQMLQCPVSVCPSGTDTFGPGINNAGQVIGDWIDEATGAGQAFIATPAVPPSGTTANGSYTFNMQVVPSTPYYIDPVVAAGYDYAIGKGDPRIATVQFPVGIGDNLYSLVLDDKSLVVAGGDRFDFRVHGYRKGISRFRVAGIEAGAGLDPANPTAFPTGLTFVGSGSFTGTMTPLCQRAPASGGRAKLTTCFGGAEDNSGSND